MLDMSFVALVVTSVLVGADVAISDYRFGRIAGRSEFLWEWCSRLHLFQKVVHVFLGEKHALQNLHYNLRFLGENSTCTW